MLILTALCVLVAVSKAHTSSYSELSTRSKYTPVKYSSTKASLWHPSYRIVRAQKYNPKIDRLRFFYTGLGKRSGVSLGRDEEQYLKASQEHLLKGLTALHNLETRHGVQTVGNPMSNWRNNEYSNTASGMDPKLLDWSDGIDDRGTGRSEFSPIEPFDEVPINTMGDAANNADSLTEEFKDLESDHDENNPDDNAERPKRWWAVSNFKRLRNTADIKDTRSFDPVFYFLGLGKRSGSNADVRHMV